MSEIWHILNANAEFYYKIFDKQSEGKIQCHSQNQLKWQVIGKHTQQSKQTGMKIRIAIIEHKVWDHH